MWFSVPSPLVSKGPVPMKMSKTVPSTMCGFCPTSSTAMDLSPCYTHSPGDNGSPPAPGWTVHPPQGSAWHPRHHSPYRLVSRVSVHPLHCMSEIGSGLPARSHSTSCSAALICPVVICLLAAPTVTSVTVLLFTASLAGATQWKGKRNQSISNGCENLTFIICSLYTKHHSA